MAREEKIAIVSAETLKYSGLDEAGLRDRALYDWKRSGNPEPTRVELRPTDNEGVKEFWAVYEEAAQEAP